MVKNVSTRDSLPRSSHHRIELIPITGLPEICEGDDLARVVIVAARRARIKFRSRDILVVAQKIVSKAEGRVAKLSGIEPSAQAKQLAAKGARDARLVEII